MYLKHLAIYVILFILLIPDIAIGLTKELQQKYINDFKTSFSNGVSNYKQKKYEQAVKDWNDALEFIHSAELQETPQIKKIKETLFLNKGEAYRNLAMNENPDEKTCFEKAGENYEKIKSFLATTKDTVNLSLYSLYSDRARRYRAIGKHINAIDYQDKAIKYAINISNKYSKKRQIMANANRSLGISQKYLGKYDEALESFQKSADYWKKVDNEKEFLKDKMNIAFVNMDTGLLIDASDQLNDIINSYKEKDKEDPLFAHTNLNLGRCDYILGNYDNASYHFEEAHVMYNKLKQKQTVDESEMPQLDRGGDAANMNLGLIACEQGLYDDALLKFDHISKKTSDEQLKTMALSNKAVVFLNYYLEDPKKVYLDNAENNLNAAKDLTEKTGDTRMNMSILQKLGKVLTERGDYANANKSFETAFDRAKKIFRKGKRPPFYEYSNILSCWADMYLRQGDPNKVENAIVNYKESIENAKDISAANEQLWYAYYGLARAYRVQRDIEKAVDNYKLSIYVIENMRDLISGSGSIGFLRNKQQVYTDLINLLLQRWEEEKDGEKKVNYSTEALIYLERSRLGALKSLFEQATPKQKENIEINLKEITYRLTKATNPMEIDELERKKDELDRRLEKDDLLIQKIKFDKDKFFFEIIKNMNPKQVIFEYYYNDENIYVWKLDKECKSPHFYPPIKIKYREKDDDVRLEGGKKPADEIDILKQIDRLYKIISDKDELFSKDEGQLWSNFYKKNNENYIGYFIEIISDKIFPFKIDDEKYDVVTIIPYGKLCLLPFSILGDKNHRLIDRDFYTNYYYSMIQAVLKNIKPEGHNLFAVGNPEIPGFISKTSSTTRGVSLNDNRTPTVKDKPEFKEAKNIIAKLKNMGLLKETEDGKAGGGRGDGFKRLEDAGVEVRDIENTFKNKFPKYDGENIRLTIRSDEKVGEDFIKDNITDDYNYLHFATHGLLVSDSPLDSFLVFSEGEVDPSKYPNDSGLLTVKEIRKNFFKKLSKTRLLTLSACQTSLAFGASGTQSALGLEFASLSGAFQSAGVNTVIASLWEVSSEVTAEIMKRFYHYLIEKGQPIGKALKSSQEEFRKNEDMVLITYYEEGKEKEDESKRDKEYLWAPFIVLGNPY